MTVFKYIAKFETLSKSGMSFINTPSKKNEKFIIGLDDHLGEKLVGHIDKIFKMLV